MKVLIIGLGSIAEKHILALRNTKQDMQIFALRSSVKSDKKEDIVNIYSIEHIPSKIDFVIISNPTSQHYNTILEVLKLKVPIFIEKPPLMDLANVEKLLSTIKRNNIKTYTAFNLRFHPVILWLKEEIPLVKVIEVQSYCGSYMPDWRPEKDYRHIYSAKKVLGGGVHLDLIHELDFILWIFGEPKKIYTFKGKKSHLEIDSVDVANYNLEYENFYITILLNYYRRDPKRTIEIVMEDQTWIVNLLKASVCKANGDILFQAENFILQDTYNLQMNYFLENIYTSIPIMNSFEESLKTLKICLM